MDDECTVVVSCPGRATASLFIAVCRDRERAFTCLRKGRATGNGDLALASSGKVAVAETGAHAFPTRKGPQEERGDAAGRRRRVLLQGNRAAPVANKALVSARIWCWIRVGMATN